MRDTLKALNIESFSINLSAQPSDPYQRVLAEILGDDLKEGQRYPVVSSRKSDDRQLTDIGWLRQTPDSIEISLMYGLLGLPKPPRSIPRLVPALRKLRESHLTFKMDCHAVIVYEHGIERSTFALPIRMFRTGADAGFDTIEGIELVRSPRDEKTPKLAVYITIDAVHETVIHSIDMNHDYLVEIEQGFERRLARQASQFSKQFLLPIG